MLKLNTDILWAGTELTYDAVLRAEGIVQQRLAAGGSVHEVATEEPNRLLTNDGNGLAMIDISGPLVNSDSFWNQFMGVTGYPEIRDALLEAAADESVKHILLNINSGGGAVSGVEDTANLIRTINDQVKPVTAYTDGVMASAAYWLGSSAGEVHVGKTSLVGSIGIISVHRENSKAMADAGIGVTVIRAGKEKALANPNEKLTEAGKAQIQQLADANYKVFVDHVSAMRGRSYDYADQQMGQGKEFVGQMCVDVGLADSVVSFDQLVSSLRMQTIDAANSGMQNRHKMMMSPAMKHMGSSSFNTTGDDQMGSKKALTAQEIAALASGASPSAIGIAGAEATCETQVEGATASAAAESHTDQSEQGADNGVQEGRGQEEVSEGAQADGGDVATLQASVQLLSSQLNASNDALIAAKVEVAKANDKVAELEAALSPMKAIVAQSLNTMQVAMGGTALDLSAMSVEALVTEHGRTKEAFASKFPVGGIAAVSGEAVERKSPAATDPRQLALVRAAGYHKK